MSHPSYRTVRTFVTLGLIVIALIVIAAINLFKPAGQTGTSQTVTDAKAVCTDNARLDAPAYQAGSGQPLALYARSGNADGQVYSGIYVLGSAPTGALHDADTAVGKNLTATYSNKTTPVLVSCIARSNETPTEQSCSYSDGKNIPVYTADYELTVYEAKTHRSLLATRIATQPTYTCASFTAYDGKGFYRAWNAAEVALALEQFVK